jgi:hypothetical protein
MDISTMTDDSGERKCWIGEVASPSEEVVEQPISEKKEEEYPREKFPVDFKGPRQSGWYGYQGYQGIRYGCYGRQGLYEKYQHNYSYGYCAPRIQPRVEHEEVQKDTNAWGGDTLFAKTVYGNIRVFYEDEEGYVTKADLVRGRGKGVWNALKRMF